jgi:PhnB protein
MATTLTPYLSFPGNTRAVFAFYARALGATVEAMLTWGEVPPPPAVPASAEGCGPTARPPADAIMHASLLLPGGARLMAGDVPPGMPFDGIRGAMLALQYDTVAEAERAFAALAEGGSITMPLAPTFWARSFGMLTDRHGVAWAVNGEPIPMA